MLRFIAKLFGQKSETVQATPAEPVQPAAPKGTASDPNMIIPLDDCNELFYALDVPSDSKAYWRWRKDDEGFRYDDIADVLGDSPNVLAHDWRESALDFFEYALPAIHKVASDFQFDFDQETGAGSVQSMDRKQAFKHHNSEDDFNTVVRSVNQVLTGAGVFVLAKDSLGSDTYEYAFFSADAWAGFRDAAPELADMYFTEVPGQ